eukprot:scaffold14008_cov124-Cylindrotheca_fusiformis.AAC.4
MRNAVWYLLHLVLLSASTQAWRFYVGPFRTWRQRNYASQLRGGDATDSDSVPVIPFVDEPPVWASKKKALVLLDTFSPYHGMFLAHRAKQIFGVAIVPVFSDYMKGYFQLEQPDDLLRLLSMCMPSAEEKDDWLKPLKEMDLIAVVCESDSGLADAEKLAVLLNTKFNNGINEARRNKYLMMEKLKEAGVPVVEQCLCQSLDEARDFAKQLGMGSRDDSCVVVKPVRGVGSEDVVLCRDMISVEAAFKRIYGATVFGSPREKHQSVLLQEFAIGTEFAIDMVSKNGEHKVAAVWKYDKRPANGASFVYYATKLFDGPEAAEICGYLRICLNELELKWGITHSEIILTADGPRLVEVNCRHHNMDFIPLTMECIGYNAFDMLLAAYLGVEEDPDVYPLETESGRLNWDFLPHNPSTRMNGAMMHLVNYKNGTLANVNDEALMEIQKMDSVLDLEVYPPFLDLGGTILPTVDIRSDAGWVQLVNPDSTQFQKDYDRIIELMPSLFEVKEK